MTPERWHRIKEIFNAALDREPDERARFVDSASGGDEEIRREVHQLVSAHEATTEFLVDTPAFEVAARSIAATEPEALAAGQLVSHYRIVGQLGAGGMGEVYLAEDARLGRKVALKFLPASLTGDPDRVKRFEQEARAASALNHPNVCTIHEIGADDAGRYFIAMEHVDGATLRRRLEGGPLDLSDALEIGVQVAAALEAAHEAGVVHRDVKPENLMLRRDGIVKVVDFGIAKLARRTASPATPDAPARSLVDTGTGTLVGTVAYMSPEQARGTGVDERTDVWSLGVVLYEMATGRQPFAGATASELIDEIVGREPAPLASRGGALPVELERIVSKALEKDRERRYGTVGELGADLKALRRKLELDAEIERGGAARPRSRRASVRLIVAIAVAFISLAVGLATVLWRAAPQTTPFQTTKITKLTTSGNVIEAAISPDGKTIAYVTREAGKQVVWVRPVAVAEPISVAPPIGGEYVGTIFSPDNAFVYYAAFDPRNPDGQVDFTLFRAPAAGGAPAKVAEHLVCVARQSVTFGPDGRLVFVRYDRAKNEATVVSASPDGTDERVVFTRTNPQPSGWPALSPDGRTLAVGIIEADGFVRLVGIDLADGSERPLTPQRWTIPGIVRVAWLADGSGLVLSGVTESSPFMQLWYVSYPGGETRRIIDDLNRYEGVGVTASADTMVSVQSTFVSNLWVAPAGDVQRAARVTSGTNRYYDLSWTPDGRILYATDASGSADVWSVAADGTGARQLTANAGLNYAPTATPDGRYVVFHSNRTGVWTIWRANPDGSDPVALATGSWPSCAPDGRWVYFTMAGAGVAKVSIEGGEPVSIEPKAGIPVVSPDGTQVACFYQQDMGGMVKVALVPAGGGPPTRVFEIALSSDVYGPPYRWVRDGSAFVYTDAREEGTNLWLQPVDGGPPRQLTAFETERINSFDVAPDGRLVMSRGTQSSDVVLITAIR